MTPKQWTAHTLQVHSFKNRDEVLASEICGCFYCLATFGPAEIHRWIDEDEKRVGLTALCPRCGVDFVIGSKTGFPLTQELLRSMHEIWFSP